MTKFNYEQRENFRRAVRLQRSIPERLTLTHLRSIYSMCRAGQKFGLYSGYQP